jgi:hypothetical protein
MMEPARGTCCSIEATTFQPHMSGVPKCNCKCRFEPERNQENLIIQLTAPCKMDPISSATNDADGATLFTEVGPKSVMLV